MPDVYVLREGDPATVAGYELVGRLGEGGQGTVFLGRDSSGHSVAVKLLHARFAGDADARARFMREVSAAKRVAEFCTARVLDVDIVGERPYIVTEYVDGPSLQWSVTEQGRCSREALERLAVGTATALSAIHQAGIVHRDFKPANVLLGPDGPRVIDFGIARILDSTATLTSHAVGTPAYMAPEQLNRGPIGPAVDVFAWSATMVFAATGAAPFGNDTVPAVIRRILRAEPELSGVPEPLRGLFAECLAKEPRSRPAIRQVLDRMIGGESAFATTPGHPATPPTGGTLVDGPQATVPVLPQWGGASTAPPGHAPVPPPKTPGRWRWWLAAAGAVLVVAMVAGIGFWVFGDEPINFTTLTSRGCVMVPAATVRSVGADPQRAPDALNELNDKGQTIDASCEWNSSPGPTSPFRQLNVDVVVERDVPSTVEDEQPKGLDRAKHDHDQKRRDLQGKAGRTETDGDGPSSFMHSHGPFTELSGFGDEAFVSSERVRKPDGSYDTANAYVRARLGNALIIVAYTAGDRPSDHVMTPMPDTVARRNAEAVAREILTYLSHCTACTR